MNPLKKNISLIKYLISRFWIGCFNKMPNHEKFDKLRQWFLIRSGISISGNVRVFSPIYISPKTHLNNIYIQGFTFINSRARFSAPANTKIVISKNCLIGPDVTFESVNHGLLVDKKSGRGAILGNIVVEEDVWIGCKTIVLQNVTIQNNSVVAAGSVVTKSVDKFQLVGGIPAKLIKKLNEQKN